MPKSKSQPPSKPETEPKVQAHSNITTKSILDDPFAAREAQKYDNPIPSREFILDFLEKKAKPLSYRALSVDFGLLDDDEQKEALRRRLKAMERDGQLVRNRKGAYGLMANMGLVKGRFCAHRDGYGFVIPDKNQSAIPDDGQSGDLYINNREANAVFHDDEVLAKVTGIDHKGRREGIIVEVTQRNTQQIVGRYFKLNRVGVVEPAGKIKKSILIPEQNPALPTVQEGQFVLITITQQPTKHTQAIGEIIEILGDHMAPGMEIDVAIHNYQLPNHWSVELLNELAQIPDQVQEADLVGRKDLRALPLVTIDGADARDFDDAVYCTAVKQGWRLYVAIADVSHYVQPGSLLDQEAYQRGTSVYFPNRVIPMLPEKLSNGLCSLNPHVDRLCMVADMLITHDGKLSRSSFYPAVMHSKARLTYDQVGDYLLDNTKLGNIPEAILPDLRQLNALFLVLKKTRDIRGAIDMDITETKIIFGADKKIERIVPTERNNAHKLIEEAMLCANVAAARMLERQKLINLYRIHGVPQQEKVEKLRGFVGDLGLKFTQSDEPTPKDYANLLSAIKNRPDQHIITLVLLRTLNQAMYTPDNIGHFGLAYKAYAHFTSPIRRYPDLLVHRGIKAALAKQEVFTDLAEMQAIGEHCSMTERRADEATRDVMDWLKCEFMLDKIDQEFEGVISSVTAFGLFVELNAIYVEGLVHVSSLVGDYYIHDAVKHILVGERTRVKYKLGDRVKVLVKNVNLDERKIDFELIKILKPKVSKK